MNAEEIYYRQDNYVISVPEFPYFGYSCIDKKYDLTKDISTIVGIGGELGFSLRRNRDKTSQRFIKT